MRKVTPITEQFEHFVRDLKETFCRPVWEDAAGLEGVFGGAIPEGAGSLGGGRGLRPRGKEAAGLSQRILCPLRLPVTPPQRSFIINAFYIFVDVPSCFVQGKCQGLHAGRGAPFGSGLPARPRRGQSLPPSCARNAD